MIYYTLIYKRRFVGQTIIFRRATLVVAPTIDDVA